jgi:hypothetical protein
MAVASLVGEKMFNFAELMEKEFFGLLINSQYEFIYYLILCFNSAKVDQFLKMMDTYKSLIHSDVNNINIIIIYIIYLKYSKFYHIKSNSSISK